MGEKKINQKVLELLNEYGVDNTELADALSSRFIDMEMQSKAFTCPKCETQLTVNLRIEVKRVSTLEDAAIRRGDDLPWNSTARFSNSEIELLKTIKSTGVYQPFMDAVERTIIQSKHTDVDRFILDWFENATSVKIPQYSMRVLISQFNGRIAVYQYQYIAAIILDGRVKAFYPYNLLKGESVSQLSPSGAQLTKTKDFVTTEIWTRSKYGYVVGKGALFSELQKKSKGAFANTGI
jgi:hypothetical protein